MFSILSRTCVNCFPNVQKKVRNNNTRQTSVSNKDSRMWRDRWLYKHRNEAVNVKEVFKTSLILSTFPDYLMITAFLSFWMNSLSDMPYTCINILVIVSKQRFKGYNKSNGKLGLKPCLHSPVKATILRWWMSSPKLSDCQNTGITELETKPWGEEQLKEVEMAWHALMSHFRVSLFSSAKE